MSDLGSATPVTPGNPVSGTLPSGNNTNLYRFDAQAGDQVVLTQQSVSGGSPSWRLIDPYGGVVYSGAFSTSGTLTLQSTGTYSLLLEGSIDASGAIGYTFNVSPQGHVTISPPTGTALTLGAVKNGTISTSGQQDSYVFTIATAASLYFDSLTSDGSLTWSLSGPRGAEVNSRSFQSSDDGSFSSSNPVLNLIAGNYVLTVTGTAGHTGSYGFRVLDLASAPAVATASNNGGQNGSGDITVTTDNHSMANAINLDGQFALTANPEISNSTTVPHVSIHATGAGAFDYYKFTVSTGGTIGIFDIDHASWDTYLNLFDSSGTRLAFNDDGGVDPGSTSGNNSFLTYTFAAAGTYYIQAAQYPNAAISTGNAYVLQVSLQVPPNASSLNPGNETDAYRFNVTAGERYFFDVQGVSTGGSIDWRLIDPYGQQVWYNSFADVTTQTLTVTGAYTLLIEGAVGNTGPVGYGFNVQKVTNTTAALTLGAQVDGAISQTGQQNLYTFTLANASQLYFDSLTNDSTFNWTLTGPRGTEINARSFQSSDADSLSLSNPPALNLIAGSYTLAVAGIGDRTGSYGFRLLDLASAPAVATGSNNGGQNGSGDITVTTDNHSTANAINLDGQFALTSNPDISNSTTIPHVSIHATGAGAFDYYKFTVATGGTTGIFDIDHASWDTYLNLVQLVGNAARVQ